MLILQTKNCYGENETYMCICDMFRNMRLWWKQKESD